MKPITNNIYSDSEIKSIQQVLKSKGHDIGNTGLNADGIDGVMGPKTIAGLRTIADSNPAISTKYGHLWGGDKTVAKAVAKPQTNETVDLQNYLISEGYNVGSTGADGKFGKNTQAALKQAVSKNPALASKYGKFIPDYKPEMPRPAGVGEMNTAQSDATRVQTPVVPSIIKGNQRTPLQLAGQYFPQQTAPSSGILKKDDRSPERRQFDKEANAEPSIRSGIRNFLSKNLPGPVLKGSALLGADAMGNEETITADAFSPEAVDFIQEMAKRLGPGKHALGGNYRKIYGGGVADFAELSPGAREVATKLGQFNIDVAKDGTIRAADRYNFNAKDEDRTISNPDAPTRAETNALQSLPFNAKVAATVAGMAKQDSPHNMVRYGIAPVWNSNNDQGANVKILIPPKEKKI